VTEQPPAVATTFELGCSTIIPTRTFERTFRLFAKAVVDEWINEQSRAESQPDSHAGDRKRSRAKSRTQST